MSPRSRTGACAFPRTRPTTFAALLLLLVTCAAPTYAQEETVTIIMPAPVARSDARKPGAPPVTGSITGRVVGDDGRPLPFVQLNAHGRNASSTFRGATTYSDEDGRFRFDDLIQGAYTISVHLPAHVLDPSPAERAAGGLHRLGDDVTLRMRKGGAVTGSVTDAAGKPLVAARVRAFRVRDFDAPPGSVSSFTQSREAQTDDRGIYRIYGLASGVYVIAAGGGSRYTWERPTPFDRDAPTYHPSSTIDTAAEVTVRMGQETSGIDVRHRGEEGKTISGTIASPPGAQGTDQPTSINLELVHASTHSAVHTDWVAPGEGGGYAFSINGVTDGDYYLQAQRTPANEVGLASEQVRVTVRGADVTGVKIALSPLASAAGKLALEPLNDAERSKAGCTEHVRLAPQEVLVTARRDDAEEVGSRPQRYQTATAAPDADGEFVLRSLGPGSYRVTAHPIDENWYVRAISLPDPAPAAANKPGAARTPAMAPAKPQATFRLQGSQRASGIRINVAEGAAVLSGHLTSGEGDARTPTAMRIHLVPAERELTDEQLRYHEATTYADGSFFFRNLAPGRYLLVVRPVASEPVNASRRPLAWDAEERTRLRREAEATNVSVELRPCQRIENFALVPFRGENK